MLLSDVDNSRNKKQTQDSENHDDIVEVEEESKETDTLLGNGRQESGSEHQQKQQEAAVGEQKGDDEETRKIRRKKFWIPAILICSDIIAALASMIGGCSKNLHEDRKDASLPCLQDDRNPPLVCDGAQTRMVEE
eukprot:755717-Hanusia_phi.AAC.4